MKKLAIVFAMLLASSSTLAQDSAAASTGELALRLPSQGRNESPRAETLFDGHSIEHGYYAAPTFGLTTIDGELAPSVGLRSAWLINQRFGLGVALNGFSNELSDSERDPVEGGYAGLLLQYVVASNRWLHGYVDTTIGGGAICVRDENDHDDPCSDYGFFAVEPTANVEANLAPWARLSLGGGYRFAVGGDRSPLSNKELGGFVLRTSVAFGRF